MIRTPEQYIESIRDGRVVYQDGKRVNDVPTHPVFKEYVEGAATEYMLARQPEYRDIFNAVADGEEVSFAFVEPRTQEDLAKRRRIWQMYYNYGLSRGTVKYTGVDALNAATDAARKMDAALGTKYSGRVDEYRKWCQKNDPGICGTVSDPKGNRRLHAEDPGQKHKDFYLRIVDRTSNGIVINGCKVHIGRAIWANELLCLPSRNHEEPGKDYALVCAVPCNAKGVTLLGQQEMGHASTIIFDNVFVPNERVFMAGEWQFSKQVTWSFARYHRTVSDMARAESLRGIAGLGMLLAEYNGLTHASRIRDMLSWLAMYAEITAGLLTAAIAAGKPEPESGLAMPNLVWINCCKYFHASHFHQAIQYLQDIAGGIPATMPSLKDWENPATRPYMDKYLGGDAKYPTEERIRALHKLNEVCSAHAGVGAIHAEGSLAAQLMTVYQQADWELYKAAAKYSMGVHSDHPAFKDKPLKPLYKITG